MTELAVTLLRLSYLALLWVFVIAALAVLRKDVFGTRITRRARAEARGSRRPSPPPAPAAARKEQRPARNAPTRLIVTQGPLSGTTLPLGPSAVLVGRAPSCTLVLDDDYASGRHARLFPQDDAWWVEDLGSTNGTLVADQPIDRPVQLAAGTQVRIGQTVIELQR
ncbi:FHA domain-containing protein [Georgenia sp. MJ173]|uniref:FHA domain-containing protein FhaB/FipA n=1 Tax=Georgenia sunbinii TaxID=3117728 RepID=UPI002F25F1FA